MTKTEDLDLPNWIAYISTAYGNALADSIYSVGDNDPGYAASTAD